MFIYFMKSAAVSFLAVKNEHLVKLYKKTNG